MVPPTSASCARAAGGWLSARVLRTPEMVTTPRVNRARLTFFALLVDTCECWREYALRIYSSRYRRESVDEGRNRKGSGRRVDRRGLGLLQAGLGGAEAAAAFDAERGGESRRLSQRSRRRRSCDVLSPVGRLGDHAARDS